MRREDKYYRPTEGSDYGRLRGDVQSLIQVSFEKFEGKWQEVSSRLDAMEVQLNRLQITVSEQVSESPSSSDSSGSTTSRKRKRKTPVTLQVL